VYQWGGRAYNEGDEFRVGRNCPVKVLSTLNGRRILQVAASSKHCLCRTSDGKVYAWGHSLEGLGYTRYLDNIIKSQEGDEEIVLTKKESKMKDKYLDLGGKYVIKDKVGYVIYKNHFFNNEKIVHVECGDTVNIALNDKGKVFVWGVGPKGELGLGKDIKDADIPMECKELEDKKISRIVSGYWHFLALSGENNNENRDLELPATQKLMKKQEPVEKEDIYSMSEQVDPFAGKEME
jgi:alpha-tubulin suppressor-like RCC1 family protein